MTISNQQSALRQTLAGLGSIGVIPKAGPALDKGIQNVGKALHRSVVDEIPAYSDSGNPDVMPELAGHTTEHIREIRRLFGGGSAGDFGFVKAHARRRAEQKFPLEATLHAYRCGHKVLSRWMRDAATASVHDDTQQVISTVADFAIEYTNIVSTIAAAEYVAQTRLIAEAEGDRRTELLSILLTGYDESDGRIARLLKRAGYLEQRLSFCVVLAQSVDPAEMENPARAERLVETINKTVVDLPIRSLIGVRDNVVTAVFSDTRRQSGWTALQTRLAERIQPKLLKVGPAAIIGMSSDQPSTSHIPKAQHEARMALDFANVADRVVQFADLPIRRLLLHYAGDEMRNVLPTWAAGFLRANKKARGALVATLRAYADADMNVLKAARVLNVHPNTIYSRMQRIKDVTGLDGQRHHALTELLLAADCSQQ